MRALKLLILICFFCSTTAIFAEECPVDYKRPWHKTVKAYCLTGDYIKDDYFPWRKNLCENSHVDHLISLKRASCAGLSIEKLHKLANDPRNIRITSGRFNQSKGSKDLSSFLDMLPNSQKEKELLRGVELMNEYDMPLDRKLSQLLTERFSFATKIIKKNKKTIAKLSKNASSVVNPKMITMGGKRVSSKTAIQGTIERIAKRASMGAARNLGSLPAEALPFVGVAAAVGVTVWELKDACDTITDLAELDDALHQKEALDFNEEEVCGLKVPSKAVILEKVRNSPSEVWSQAREYIPELESYKNVELPDLDWNEMWVSSKSTGATAIEKAKGGIEKTKGGIENLSNKMKGFWNKD
jgi:hypothetical protein